MWTQGTMDRLVYDHTSSEKSMTWEVDYSAHKDTLGTMRSLVTEADGVISVYMTIHLKESYGGSNTTNDAYLIGAKIQRASPNYATLRCGIEDIGADYDNNFTFWGAPNPTNAGLFTKNGFQIDSRTTGVYDGNTYPHPDSLDSSKLPTASQLENISITFEKSGDTPDL
jgi:hypothetical protein